MGRGGKGGRGNYASITLSVAQEFLTVLIVLYPLLLLLDSVEPGFVRSVINPHAFLLVLIVVAALAPKDDARAWSRRIIFVFTMVAAPIAGAWVWWSVGRGALGAVVGALTAVAVVSAVLGLSDSVQSSSSS